jgi:hypothetical protein
MTLACAHTEPFGTDGAGTLGPPGSTPPLRLTFNPGDDRSPAFAGGQVVYSRYDPSRGTSAQCVARLPADGGTLAGLGCPPGPTPPDTFVSTWLEPALAEDGSALAFVWQRGARVSALAAWSHHLVVAPAGAPGSPTLEVFLADSVTGGTYNSAYELTWIGTGRVRFIAAYEFIPKVKGGGPDRFTDTTLVAAGLLDLDLATGTLVEVPGGAGVTAYTAASDGALWVVRADTLWSLDAAGTATPLVEVGPFVTDIALVDGRMVAARSSPDSVATDTVVSWWDPASGGRGEWSMPGPVHPLTAIGGRRLVAEVEVETRLFGAPANLWLFETPPRLSR